MGKRSPRDPVAGPRGYPCEAALTVLRATKDGETYCGAGYSARSLPLAGSGRLKGGCGQDWPPHGAFSTVPHT